MKYFAINEEIEGRIRGIKRDIMLSMNGVCAENIAAGGLDYRQNYGVSFARLRELAARYEMDYELAYRLLLLPIRETKLMAAMLCPPQELTAENVTDWVGAVTNQEMAEVMGFCLLRRAAHLKVCYMEMAEADEYMKRLTAYHTLARLCDALDEQEAVRVIRGIRIEDLEQVSAYRAVETFLLSAKGRGSAVIGVEMEMILGKMETAEARYAKVLAEVLRAGC